MRTTQEVIACVILHITGILKQDLFEAAEEHPNMVPVPNASHLNAISVIGADFSGVLLCIMNTPKIFSTGGA